MLSRMVAPVLCQPIPQGLPPDTVIVAEPLPPQGRYGALDSQAGTADGAVLGLHTFATCVFAGCVPGFGLSESGPDGGGGDADACSAGLQKPVLLLHLWP